MHDTRDKPSNQSLPEVLDIMCVLDEIIDALEKETSSGFPGKLLKEVPFVSDAGCIIRSVKFFSKKVSASDWTLRFSLSQVDNTTPLQPCQRRRLCGCPQGRVEPGHRPCYTNP